MRKLIALSLLALSFAASAQQATIGIMPLGGPVPESEKIQALTLTNVSDVPTKLQVQTYLWTQVGGKDVLTRTNEIAATPGVVDLPAKSKRVVRIARIGSNRYFRIKISELPKAGSQQQTVVGFRLEYSVPYLFLPANAPAPRLTARMAGSSLELANPSTAPARITNLTANGKPVPAFWVLPGSSMLVPAASAASVSLKVNGTPTTLPVQ